MKQNGKTLQVEKLKEERIQILQKLTELQELLQVKTEADSEDAAIELEARGNVAALVHTLEDRLSSIEHALQQLQHSTTPYGICERCGKPIDPARLEALPETTFCIQCKLIVEQQGHTRRRI
jgi:RNA polymerase-binding transcription factor DksA